MKREKKDSRFQKALTRQAFLIPALFLIIIFIGYPIVQTIYLSFFSRSGDFVGLANYERVVTDPETVNPRNLPWPPPLGTLLHNSLWITIHLPVSLLAGLWLALIVRDIRGASVVKSTIFLGMVTPMIAGGVMLQFLLESGVGLVPSFFSWIGIEELSVSWIRQRETTLLGLIFGSVWLWTGFSLIVYSAGLTTIPREYFEAAKIDGTSALRTFFRITFPLLKPMTLVVLTMTILWELKIFDIVFVAVGVAGGTGLGPGGGAADVLALQMFRYGFLASDFGRASAVATILTLLTLLAAIGLIRYMVKR